MPSTNYTPSTPNSTNWIKNPAYDTDATRLNSTTVTLGDLTVTLLGYPIGTNFDSNSLSTNFTPGTVNSTNWGTS